MLRTITLNDAQDVVALMRAIEGQAACRSTKCLYSLATSGMRSELALPVSGDSCDMQLMVWPHTRRRSSP